MPLRILSGSQDAPLEPLRDRRVVVVGFGSQGAAHALNLRDSEIDVVVANRPDTGGWQRAVDHGFTPVTIEAGLEHADLLIVALPDETHAAVWSETIAPRLRAGVVVGFLHGFSVRYGRVAAPPGVGLIMVAPKGPGHTLRQRYEEGLGIPCLFAVEQESATPGTAEALGLAWANGIGCARAAIVCTTFADETETDLFGEQAVLCGGMSWLVLVAFETLVDAGYPPELAYVECCQEVKQVADLVYERGPAGMMEAVSNTAEFGAHRTGRRLIDETLRSKLKELLAEIRSGDFADALRRDHDRGHPWFEARRREMSEHAIERAGQVVRNWWGRDPGGKTGSG